MSQDAANLAAGSAAHGGATPAQIAAWLEAARAERRANLGRGLEAATRAWSAAGAQGFLAEQLEAGRLRAFFLFRRGELAEMLEAGKPLLPILREQGSSAALCELLRWTALAAADLGDFEAALASANESLARARELGDARLSSVALNAVGACFERMGDPWQAERLMNEAAALLGAAATDLERLITLNNLAAVALGRFYLLRGGGHPLECIAALEQALAHSEAARPHAQALEDPFGIALTDGNRGETLLHLGQFDEAELLLRAALELDRAHGFVVLGWRVRCSLAELKLARGDMATARAELDTLLAETAGRLQGPPALRFHHVAYRAAKAQGDGLAALALLERCQALERERGVAQLLAQARFFVSKLEAERRAPAGGDEPGLFVRPSADELRDPLTGLGNRRCLESRLPALVRAAEQDGTALTLAMIDVDGFKAINDEHGAAVGDRVLQLLAQMLVENTRGRDLLLRWGGEEILVVLPETVPDRAFEVCERLREVVETFPWGQVSPGLAVTLSIGMAAAPPHSTDQLIARAESAMYRAKHLGRNRVALA